MTITEQELRKELEELKELVRYKSEVIANYAVSLDRFGAQLEELRMVKSGAEIMLKRMQLMKNIEKHDYYRIDLAISELEEILK
jgi:hypothetical protein